MASEGMEPSKSYHWEMTESPFLARRMRFLHELETEGIIEDNYFPSRISAQTSTEWIHRRIEHGQTKRYRKTSERTPVQSPQPRRDEIVRWKAGPMARGRLETC